MTLGPLTLLILVLRGAWTDEWRMQSKPHAGHGRMSGGCKVTLTRGNDGWVEGATLVLREAWTDEGGCKVSFTRGMDGWVEGAK